MNQLLKTSSDLDSINSEFNIIIDKISNGIHLNDEHIEDDLKVLLEKLDNENKKEKILFLHKNFPKASFLNLPYFRQININQNNTQEQIDGYKQMYQDNLNEKQFDLILQELKNEQYCKQNLIPFQIKDYLIPLKQLKNNIHLIFELIEIVKDKTQYNFFSIQYSLLNCSFLNVIMKQKDKFINQQVVFQKIKYINLKIIFKRL
ncbi:unnamed protein product [Paramecium primaurelia]|uniref:Uncharacterized protein n=1 Tax=Paramecium primaurelia TaxID=5886 RepID=A0A8S1MHZ0_PARPR|nr:unnamed protein product [Paramecium primaurelia]